MFARDHGRGIFAEQQLAAGGVFRRDHIDGLVGVHVYIASRVNSLAMQAPITSVPSRQRMVSTMVVWV